MLLNALYKIVEKDEANKKFAIELNAQHPIYAGHFPSRPITPGVCSIEMITTCASQLLNKELTLASIRQCRLKDLITPTECPKIFVVFDKIEMLDTSIDCKARIENEKKDLLLTISCTFVEK